MPRRRCPRIFSPQFKFETWRRLWLWLAEEERRLGLPIPEDALVQMRAHLSDIDFEAAAAEEAKTRHDVMAHVRVFGAAAPAARGIIHWGATSAYVTDNADLIQMRDGLALDRAPARLGAPEAAATSPWRTGTSRRSPTRTSSRRSRRPSASARPSGRRTS